MTIILCLNEANGLHAQVYADRAYISMCLCMLWSNICLHSQAQGDWEGAKQRVENQSDKRQEEQKKRKTEREGIEREIDEMKESETERGR